MILANATVVDETFASRKLDVRIGSGQIQELGENLNGEDRIDCTGKYILPGFIDIHIHGAYGQRISDASPDLAKITAFEATQGVTGLCITTASSKFEDILRQFDIAVEAAQNSPGAKIWGIHAEGPFISKKYKGAMNPEYVLEPNTQKLQQMIEKGQGLLKVLTVAPEGPGALELIRYAKAAGLTVSMGHTDAHCDCAVAAIEAGATQATHTFNAMRSLHHREPGILGAVLTDERVRCEMICDHVHLHPAILRMIYRLKGADNICIISDSGHAAGLDVAEFTVDGLTRYVRNGTVRLADGTLAGSAKTVLDGVKNLLEGGIPMEDVAKMAAYNPAEALGIQNITGSIAPGKRADLVILDQDLQVCRTYVCGECVYGGG